MAVAVPPEIARVASLVADRVRSAGAATAIQAERTRSGLGDRMPPGHGARDTDERRGYGWPLAWDAGALASRIPAPVPIVHDWRADPANPSPSSESRERLWRLRHALRPLGRITSPCGQHSRIRSCGIACAAEGVGVLVDTSTGRARFRGIQTCGSVWECPTCRSKIAARRAEMVTEVVRSHGEDRAVMVTATIRHELRMPLRELARGLSAAWRRFKRGAPFRRFAERVGLQGTIRAMEVTVGANGWHPHIHAVWLLSSRQKFKGEGGRAEWQDEALGWLRSRWAEMVARELGEDCRPEESRIGFHVTPAHRADYIAKLGLEMADPGVKDGRGGNLSPFGVAQQWAATRDHRWAKVWRAYCRAIKGSRHLTWSRGLLERYRVADRPDADLAHDEDQAPSEVEVARITRDEWVAIRSVTRDDGSPLPLWILTAAEKRGGQGCRDAVRAAVVFASP